MAHVTKYNKGVVAFIIDHIEDGMTLSEICKKYHPEHVPTEKMIYTWKKKYPEFKVLIDEAYQTFFYKKIDELEDLSKLCMTLEKELEDHEKKLSREGVKDSAKYSQLKAHALKNRDRRDNVRLRLDALKFIIQKVLPKFCDAFKETQTAQQTLPPIQIVNYLPSETPVKLLN